MLVRRPLTRWLVIVQHLRLLLRQQCRNWMMLGENRWQIIWQHLRKFIWLHCRCLARKQWAWRDSESSRNSWMLHYRVEHLLLVLRFGNEEKMNLTVRANAVDGESAVTTISNLNHILVVSIDHSSAVHVFVDDFGRCL